MEPPSTASNDDAAPEIGPRLQARRRALGWTLEDLAARSGVSRSMLSQIERGRANPTFATLWGLTRALGLDLSELGETPAASGAVEVAPAHFTPEIKSADGLCTLRILSPIDLAGRTEWYELTVEPGGALVSEPHAAGSREHLTALDGALEIESGPSTGRVEAGATARYAADAPHIIRNGGAEPARALLVVLRDT
ncbi:MAG: XRE family transcriptional regulator [Pseudomonadota bacterium]